MNLLVFAKQNEWVTEDTIFQLKSIYLLSLSLYNLKIF